MTVAPSPIDLTTLSAVKAWLGATSAVNDDITQRTITNVSRFILTWLGRTVLPANFVERYDGPGSCNSSRIVLRNWPVISIAAASIGNSAITAAPIPGPGSTFGNGYLLSPPPLYPPGAQQWLDFPGWFLPRGAQNIGISYRAGYAASETIAIPSTPGQFTPVQALGNWGSDEGVTINGVAAVKVALAPTSGQYAIALNQGVPTYQFAAADAGLAAVVTYGYVPQDIAQAAIEMISFRFKARDNIGVSSKSLGGQETISFSQQDMTSAVASMLGPYRRVF